MSQPALEIAALVKDYRGLRPLRVQQLRLDPGQRLAVLGFDEPTAEVMTTLITGAAVPDAGEVRVLGTLTTDIRDADEWVVLVDRIGIVTERAALLESMSVIQNLSMPFTLDIDPPPAGIRERAARLAEEVGLSSSSWDERAGVLDGEQRARLHLARALALDPLLLILEHPTSRVARDAVRRLASDIGGVAERRGVAMLTLTADDEFAHAVASQVVMWEPARGIFRERRRGWRLWAR